MGPERQSAEARKGVLVECLPGCRILTFARLGCEWLPLLARCPLGHASSQPGVAVGGDMFGEGGFTVAQARALDAEAAR